MADKFLYKVTPLSELTWSIEKYPEGSALSVDSYSVALDHYPEEMPLEECDVTCTCPGFRMQKYDKRMHKHVQLVLAHLSRDGEPEVSVYRLAKDNTPILADQACAGLLL